MKQFDTCVETSQTCDMIYDFPVTSRLLMSLMTCSVGVNNIILYDSLSLWHYFKWTNKFFHTVFMIYVYIPFPFTHIWHKQSIRKNWIQFLLINFNIWKQKTRINLSNCPSQHPWWIVAPTARNRVNDSLEWKTWSIFLALFIPSNLGLLRWRHHAWKFNLFPKIWFKGKIYATFCLRWQYVYMYIILSVNIAAVSNLGVSGIKTQIVQSRLQRD